MLLGSPCLLAVLVINTLSGTITYFIHILACQYNISVIPGLIFQISSQVDVAYRNAIPCVTVTKCYWDLIPVVAGSRRPGYRLGLCRHDTPETRN